MTSPFIVMTVDDADLARCALPERPNADDDADDDAVPRLDVSSGATLRMDHLGPLVVSESGSLSRITNWGEMSEREREVARERIAKRNEARLRALREARGDDGR